MSIVRDIVWPLDTMQFGKSPRPEGDNSKHRRPAQHRGADRPEPGGGYAGFELSASRLEPLAPFPLASPARFSRSVQEPN
jgi:hypothetical protein